MLNIAAVMGRLTADPELKTTQGGVSVTSFRVAVERTYVPQGQERQTDFLTVVAWRGTAEFICKYFAKGDMIAVSGSIQTRNYEDRNENKHTAFEIVASEASFCGGKNKAESPAVESQRKRLDLSAAEVENDDLEEIMKDDDLPF